jgi:glycerophosphoryl diester phosphodiesterase
MAWLLRRFADNWRQFLVIHVIVNIIVFVLLAPAATLLLRLAISLSGEAALSDQDILLFFVSPGGFLSLLVLGSVFTIIVILEHAALLTATVGTEEGRPATTRHVLAYLFRRANRLFMLVTLILLRTLLHLLPYVAATALVYFLLLSDYDINYYLAEKPPEWHRAVLFGALIAVAAAIHLLRLLIGWLFALPLLLFSDRSSSDALKESRAAARGNRIEIGAWVVACLLFGLILTLVFSGLLRFLGSRLLPLAGESLEAILVLLSALSLAGFLLSFALTFINYSLFSLVILKLFEDRGLRRSQAARIQQSIELNKAGIPGRRVIGTGLVAGLLIAIAAVYFIGNRLDLEDHTRVMAHRGASAAAPENTIAAIQGAIDAGAHWVEIDVQESKDGEVVVIHDSDLKKIGGVSMTVADSSLRQLQQVDIGSWFDPKFSDQRIPTLRQVLQLCRGRIGVNIELKYYGRQRQLEQRVAEIVEASGMVDEVVIMSLSYDGIKKMRELRPDWTLGLLSTVSLGNLADLDVDFLALNGRAATRRLVRSVQARGKQVLVWTVNDPVGMTSMTSRGVDAIITDEPALAVSILGQRRELDTLQRLLLQMADVFDQPALVQEQ